MSARSLGRSGEESAALYLAEQGYTILGRNVYIAHDEIDIIARNDTHLLFVEVKTRRADPDRQNRFGRPAAAIDANKRAHLLQSARAFLQSAPEEYAALIPNIDVIEVFVDPSAAQYRVLRICHIRNAVNGMRGNA